MQTKGSCLKLMTSGFLYTQSQENDLDNTVHGGIPSFGVVYLSWTAPNQNLQLQECQPASKAILMFSKWCKKTQQWVLCPQSQEYAVVIPTMFTDLHGWADWIDLFIQVVKQINKIDIVQVGTIVGLANLVRENTISGGTDSVCLANNNVDFDTYWTVY
jgi:hypothetical protein